MGCICSKGLSDDEINKFKKQKWSKKPSKRRALSSSKKKRAVVEGGEDGTNETMTTRLIPTSDEKIAGSNILSPCENVVDNDDDNQLAVVERPAVPQLQRWATTEHGLTGAKLQLCRAFDVRNGVDGAHVVAGWPSWLSAVAGEAIQGWLPRKFESFEKLEKIGQGTYSSVYRARDLETGKLVALKKVRFCSMDPESVRFMSREIIILRTMDHPNVMKLLGLITSRVSSNVNLIFEYMEHDLAGLMASPEVTFTEPQIKCYMQQLLSGLEHCHSRGVLHRDIKGSNLLVDNNGNLKIADFGLATILFANEKRPLTSRVVTLWYRPPELLLGATDYGEGVDLWSSGCILAELFVGKAIMPGRTEVEQLHKIFRLCGSPSEQYWKRTKLPHGKIFKPQRPYKRRVAEVLKDLPPSALALLETLLAFEPEDRGKATSALQSKFFLTLPPPCDPSSMPKYPASKEYDARRRYEELRRQSTAVGKRGAQSFTKWSNSKESKAVPRLITNAELQASLQKWRGQENLKNNVDKHNPDQEDGDSKGSLQTGTSKNSLDVVHEDQPDMISHKPFDLKTQKSYKPCASEATAAAGPFTSSQQADDADSPQGFAGRSGSPYKPKGEVNENKNKKPVQHSGPLMVGSVEKLIQEHEKLIQIAVRKARLDRNKTRKWYSEDPLPDFGPDS